MTNLIILSNLSSGMNLAYAAKHLAAEIRSDSVQRIRSMLLCTQRLEQTFVSAEEFKEERGQLGEEFWLHFIASRNEDLVKCLEGRLLNSTRGLGKRCGQLSHLAQHH
jgi:predicted NACHT family NTPase